MLNVNISVAKIRECTYKFTMDRNNIYIDSDKYKEEYVDISKSVIRCVNPVLLLLTSKFKAINYTCDGYVVVLGDYYRRIFYAEKRKLSGASLYLINKIGYHLGIGSYIYKLPEYNKKIKINLIEETTNGEPKIYGNNNDIFSKYITHLRIREELSYITYDIKNDKIVGIKTKEKEFCLSEKNIFKQNTYKHKDYIIMINKDEKKMQVNKIKL